MTSENDRITSGRSGDAKFKQLVTAIGFAPTQMTFRAASATASLAPSFALTATYRPLPSRHIATARRVSLIRLTAASAPGSTAVFVRTIVSYCSYTQRFEAIFGDASSRRKASLQSGGKRLETEGTIVWLAAPVSCLLSGFIGRSYFGASSVSALTGRSASSLP